MNIIPPACTFYCISMFFSCRWRVDGLSFSTRHLIFIFFPLHVLIFAPSYHPAFCVLILLIFFSNTHSFFLVLVTLCSFNFFCVSLLSFSHHTPQRCVFVNAYPIIIPPPLCPLHHDICVCVCVFGALACCVCIVAS